MSDPRRYIAKAVILPVKEDNTYDIEAVQDPNGDWVAWEDYASLQAEVKRLRKAGIAMGMCLPDTDEANKAYRDFENGGRS